MVFGGNAAWQVHGCRDHRPGASNHPCPLNPVDLKRERAGATGPETAEGRQRPGERKEQTNRANQQRQRRGGHRAKLHRDNV